MVVIARDRPLGSAQPASARLHSVQANKDALIKIYLDIHLNNNFDTNIFGYSFV